MAIEINDSWSHIHPALNIPASIVDTVVSVDIPDGSLIAMVTAAYIVPASFTSLVTGSIAAYLLLARRRLTKILGMCPMI